MTLSTVDLIQTLALDLGDLEEALKSGRRLEELNDETDRIGDLYAAVMTRGQLASEADRKAYTVISGQTQRTSVRTLTTSHRVRLFPENFHLVDRVIVLKLGFDGANVALDVLFDATAETALATMARRPSGIRFQVEPLPEPTHKAAKSERVTAHASVGRQKIVQYDEGTIKVFTDSVEERFALPELKKIAKPLNVAILNGQRNPKNTRTLGADIIRALNDGA